MEQDIFLKQKILIPFPILAKAEMLFEWRTCSNSSFIYFRLKQQTGVKVLLVILQTGTWTTTCTFTLLQFWEHITSNA